MCELTDQPVEPRTTRRESRLGALTLLTDLRRALGEEFLLERECGKRLLGLGGFRAVVFELLAGAAGLGVEAAELVVGGHAGLADRLGFATQLVELAVECLESRVGLPALRGESLEFAAAYRRTCLGVVQLLAKLREPRDQVLALFLEQQQACVEALEDRLHPATLLREIPDEQALLLEQRLELREFALLLG